MFLNFIFQDNIQAALSLMIYYKISIETDIEVFVAFLTLKIMGTSYKINLLQRRKCHYNL